MTDDQLNALAAEKWMPMVGHPKYEVSDMGRCRRAKDGVLLSLCKTNRGYMQAHLWEDGKGKAVLVHRAVLIAFDSSPPSDRHHAAHQNGDRCDNRLSNLKWMTPKENIAQKKEHGTMPYGEATNSCRLSVYDVRVIRSSPDRSGILARRYGVNRTTIQRIRRGETWMEAIGDG